MNNAPLIYLILIINALAFVLFGVDKWKAIHNRWRIPEATLLGICVIGGSIGGLLGMHVFHHKTLKPRFRIGVPVIIAVQIVLVVIFYSKFYS